MRRLRYRIEYLALSSYAAIICALPRAWALRSGEWMGELAWRLRLRRKVVLENLAAALPNRSSRELRAIGRTSSRNFGRATTEFARVAGRDRGELSRYVEFDGLEDLEAALAEGNGALIVTGHIGSWALYFSALACFDVSTALLVGRQSNPMVDRFIHDIPAGSLQLIGKGTLAPRHVLRSLKSGRAVIFVADQYSRVGQFLPFLGRPARTLTLPGAILARDPTRPLFVMAGTHTGHGRHRVRLERQPPPGASCTPEQIARHCNDRLGEAILEAPDQYFWHHRRWKVVAHHENTPSQEELDELMSRSD